MFGKRRLTGSGASGDPSGCKRIHARLRCQHIDDFNFPSEETENCGLREDSPRYHEGICRLLSFPQVRTWRDKRAHQALRGIR